MILSELTEYEEYYSDELKNLENIDVTVQCMTYNHIKFIRKCLDGFVNQKFTGNMEVVIFDDASTDGTSDIVREYAKKYPDIIHAFIAKTNTYGHSRRREMICDFRRYNHRGKYIALCEGDDYWIYDLKIQKQYDFMESHRGVSMCCHNAIRYNDSEKEVILQIADLETGILDDNEVFNPSHGRPATASYFCRKEYTDSFSNEQFFYACPVGDEPLRMWCAANGVIYYMDKVWSVRSYLHSESWNYRMQNDEAYRIDLWKRYIFYLFLFNKRTNYKFRLEMEKSIDRHAWLLVHCKDVENMRYEELKKWIAECDSMTENRITINLRNLFFHEVRNCKDYRDVVFKVASSNPDRLFIYGAGLEARKCANELIENQLDFAGFVVTDISKNENEIMNHQVVGIDDIDFCEEQPFFWLGLNQMNRESVFEILIKKGAIDVI